MKNSSPQVSHAQKGVSNDPPANQVDYEEDKFLGFTGANVHKAENKLWSIMDIVQDIKSQVDQCANLENETAVFMEKIYTDTSAQKTEEEKVIEEDHDDFQQMPSAAKAASQLTSAVR